ncbi:MAG: hypothetical protein KGL44_09090 [Sphingomonadales bacterium]|nr:hypothetical protein [Sphingomonadales bacterium]
MADSSNSTRVPCATPDNFDPVEWLAEFERNGGWWLLGADYRLTMSVQLAGFTDNQNEIAGRMFIASRNDPELSDALRAHFRGLGVSMEASGRALPAVASLAAPNLVVSGDAVPSQRPDARFWEAHNEWRRRTDAWDADPSEERWDNHGDEVCDALTAMWMIPVSTALALLTKLNAVEFQDINLPEPVGSSMIMAKWDFDRIVARELA